MASGHNEPSAIGVDIIKRFDTDCLKFTVFVYILELFDSFANVLKKKNEEFRRSEMLFILK